jgi:hypothetical protein
MYGYLVGVPLWHHRPPPSGTSLILSAFSLIAFFFVIREIINSLFYGLTLSMYPGESFDALREIVIIGVAGLFIHMFIIGWYITKEIRSARRF